MARVCRSEYIFSGRKYLGNEGMRILDSLNGECTKELKSYSLFWLKESWHITHLPGGSSHF